MSLLLLIVNSGVPGSLQKRKCVNKPLRKEVESVHVEATASVKKGCVCESSLKTECGAVKLESHTSALRSFVGPTTGLDVMLRKMVLHRMILSTVLDDILCGEGYSTAVE